jgi:hypothetical protein
MVKIKKYTFCGDSKDAPDDQFVQQVISTYNTMFEKGGGSFTELVQNEEFNVGMVENTEGTNRYYKSEEMNEIH